jgi:hypothetical protein
MQVRAAVPDEVDRIKANYDGLAYADTQFVVLGDGLHMGWVVCSRVDVAENDLEYWQPAEFAVDREVPILRGEAAGD